MSHFTARMLLSRYGKLITLMVFARVLTVNALTILMIALTEAMYSFHLMVTVDLCVLAIRYELTILLRRLRRKLTI